MGNVVQGLNNDGENSQLFMGNYHNVKSTTANFTSPDVNFSGTGQNIDFKGTGQTVTFGSGVKVTYNNQPILTKGISFNDSNNISIGGTQLFQNGLLNPILIPSDLPVNTISDFTNLSATGTINSNNLITTGYSQAVNTLYVGTGAKGYEDSPFKVDNNGDLITSGKVSTSSVSAINLYGNLTGNVTGDLTGNVTGDNINANSITGKVFYGSLSGNVTGNLKGDVNGNLKGNVEGDLYGNVIGNLKGNVEGDVKGDNVSAKTISVSNGLLASAVGSATNGPSGGLKINGQNNWIISENSTGNLCFYNTTSGLENATTLPFFCISSTGNLVKGTV